MRNGNSRTADKFVIRLPDGVRSRVEDAAKADHTSMITFIVQAVEEKLARPTRQALLLESPQQVNAATRLIGWRTSDYLMETANQATAQDWSVHYQILPIFEGDANTQLPGGLAEVSA